MIMRKIVVEKKKTPQYTQWIENKGAGRWQDFFFNLRGYDDEIWQIIREKQ